MRLSKLCNSYRRNIEDSFFFLHEILLLKDVDLDCKYEAFECESWFTKKCINNKTKMTTFISIEAQKHQKLTRKQTEKQN